MLVEMTNDVRCFTESLDQTEICVTICRISKGEKVRLGESHNMLFQGVVVRAVPFSHNGKRWLFLESELGKNYKELIHSVPTPICVVLIG